MIRHEHARRCQSQRWADPDLYTATPPIDSLRLTGMWEAVGGLSQNWQQRYTYDNFDHGFKVTRASTYTFRLSERDIDMILRGGDVVSSSSKEDLQCTRKM